MPPQIARLVLLTIGIVTIYLTARYFLTPPTFGDYGWYRGAALAEISMRSPVHAGKKACLECHLDEHEEVAGGEHRNLSCEACHGAAQDHAQNPDLPLAKPTYSQCVRCHEAEPARPKWHPQISSREHYPGDRCTECHIPHDPNQSP
jgi:hypothetical protein